MNPGAENNRRSTSRSADGGLYFVLLALLAWAPIPLSSDHIWSESLLIIGTLGLLVAWLIQYLRGRVTVSAGFHAARLPLGLLVLFQLWVAIQLGFSLNPVSTLHYLLIGLCLTAIFALTLLLVHSERRVRILLWVFVLGGVFQASFGTMMVLTGYEHTFFLQKTAFIGNNVGTMIYKNQQAGFLVLCLSAGIGLMIADMQGGAKNWKQWVVGFSNAVVGSKGRLRVALVIMVAGLVMTRSRMGNSSFAVALAIVGAIYLLARKESRVTGMIFLSSLLAIDMVVLGFFFDLEELTERLVQTDLASDGRAEMAPISWATAQAYLWFGSGLGTFTEAVGPHKTVSFRSLRFYMAHMDYLQFWIEVGVVGGALLCGFWLACVVRAVKSLVASKRQLSRGMGFGALMVLVAIAMHSAVDYNLQATGYAYSFLVLMACLFAVEGVRSNRRSS